ncbi:hypothetical protein EFM07_09660 [Lactococcus lactis]|uniref:hypothetical protein n=1 Tax=Lactococcus lactis TaxID=1358 RepID=UPI00223BD043|nr:hypothetical protein [Lactococcus lactis]MCT1227667.1 hypothetical protein [Lactococcus lactis]
MKIIQAVHINGTDKHKRYWKVPDHLQPIRLHKGDEAAVETKTGPQTEILIRNLFFCEWLYAYFDYEER